MHKYLIAALLIAAGCDATRRDFKYCNAKYNQCDKGYSCNLTTEMCEPDVVDAPVDRPQSSEVTPPVDVTPGEVAADTRDAPVIDVTPGEVAAIDGPSSDVPIGVDGAVPDTRIPDAAGTCAADSDCTGAGATVCVNFRCVACRTNAQCGGATPFCSASNTCVSCASAPGGDAGVCSGTTPVCDRGSGRCVECTQNNECKASASKSFCVANQCQGCNVPGASASTGSADGGVADGGSVDAGVVGPCLGATPICATSGSLVGQCVQCLSSADCSGSKPICDSATNTCGACTTDKQCADKGGGPGVCMSHQDGRCALESETIYVKNPSSCTAPGNGSSTTPFCATQDAIGAVISSKRVLVLRGPATDVLTPISATPSGSQVTIIGQNGATIDGGGAIGIRVTAGDIYIRGLTVAGGNKVGIHVESGATLRLNRSIIKENAGGGLIVNSGAEFDVANSVFDGNGPGSDGQGRYFGGVLLLTTPTAGKKTRFWFNTVLKNLDKGVVCSSSSQVLEGLLMVTNVNGDMGNCTFPVLANPPPQKPSSSSNTDANDSRAKPFDPGRPYHLVKGSSTLTTSPCIDYIWDPTVQYPTDDIDGETRPYGAGADCGADEYRP